MKKRKTILLATYSGVVTLLTIGLTVWNIQLQLRQNKFDKKQRLAEMTIHLADIWERGLDPETRYRLTRFREFLKELNRDQQEELTKGLLDRQIISGTKIVAVDSQIGKLIAPDLENGLGSNAIRQVSNYRASVIRTLNTMEMMAVVRTNSEQIEGAQEVIDVAYTAVIKQVYLDVKLFIDEYRSQTNKGRIRPAWQPLTELVENSPSG